MKAQNKEEKLAKQQEREKLQREIAAREKAERIQSEYEDRLKKMQADMELRQKALLDAQSTIKLLEDQLKETQVNAYGANCVVIFRYEFNRRGLKMSKHHSYLFHLNLGRQRGARSTPTRTSRYDAETGRKQKHGSRGKG